MIALFVVCLTVICCIKLFASSSTLLSTRMIVPDNCLKAVHKKENSTCRCFSFIATNNHHGFTVTTQTMPNDAQHQWRGAWGEATRPPQKWRPLTPALPLPAGVAMALPPLGPPSVCVYIGREEPEQQHRGRRGRSRRRRPPALHP